MRSPRMRAGKARLDYSSKDPKSGKVANLTAAAQILSSPKIKREGSRAQKQGSSLPWQAEAWALFDLIGEYWYACNWVGNAASRARLIAARATPGAADPTPVEDGIPAELVADWAGGPASQSQILLRAGVHLTLAGDTYITGRTLREDGDEAPPPAPGPGGPAKGLPPIGGAVLEGQVTAGEAGTYEEWCAYSTDEVMYDGGKWQINDGAETFEIGDADVIMRCWRPHPRKHHEATSPVRATLPVLRELHGLTKHVAAQIDSRLAGNGILFLPQSMTFPTGQAGQGGDATEGEDAFVRDLIDAMLTSIKDRDSAAAVVPLVVKVPDDSIGKVQWISFSSPLDEKAKELRDEALRRFALGMDMPPEIVLGVGDVNHWSAWAIDESSIKLHIEPLLATICLALTVGWFRPALEAAGVQDSHDYLVWFDTTELKQRPNRAAEAMDLFDRFVIGPAALLREAGFDDTDAPSPVELARMVLLNLAKTGVSIGPILAALGVPPEVVDEITAGVGDTPPGGEAATPSEADGGRALPTPPTGTDTEGDAP